MWTKAEPGSVLDAHAATVTKDLMTAGDARAGGDREAAGERPSAHEIAAVPAAAAEDLLATFVSVVVREP